MMSFSPVTGHVPVPLVQNAGQFETALPVDGTKTRASTRP